MTDVDRRRITEWIGDAFAILCVRVGGYSEAESKVRLGVEAILRQLGTPPLRAITRSPPPLFSQSGASTADLRHIIKALDCSLAIFDRYASALNTAERRVELLIRATRRYAEEELLSRNSRPISASPFATATAA
jgi:hypothetical protein